MDPQAKVLIMTGYALDDNATQVLEMGAKGVLNKPFRAQEIGNSIRRILDEELVSAESTPRRSGPELNVVSSK